MNDDVFSRVASSDWSDGGVFTRVDILSQT